MELDVVLRRCDAEEGTADGREGDARVRELPFAGGVGAHGGAEHATEDLVSEADA